MNPTTDPALRSFVPVAPDSHFPIQNLPYGIFVRDGGSPAVGVAIGDFVLDLSVMEAEGFFDHTSLRGKQLFNRDSLNAFMALGRPAWTEARATISHLLRADVATLRDNKTVRSRALIENVPPVVEMLLPVEIGDYTDFYSSREHATNVGTMLRGADNALQPNWLHLPVAYHGRVSSIVASGAHLRRPLGQTKPADSPAPIFGPSKSLDFELEMGAFVGTGNRLSRPIAIENAADHLFGMVLVNDWSRPRHPSVGIRPTRAVPCQELSHIDFPVGGDTGRAGAVSDSRACPGSAATSVLAESRQLGV